MPRVGMRIVKTFVAVFICMLLNILFMLLNKWFDLGIVDANGLVIFYTPFFATIALYIVCIVIRKIVYLKQKLDQLGQ